MTEGVVILTLERKVWLTSMSYDQDNKETANGRSHPTLTGRYYFSGVVPYHNYHDDTSGTESGMCHF